MWPSLVSGVTSEPSVGGRTPPYTHPRSHFFDQENGSNSSCEKRDLDPNHISLIGEISGFKR